MLKFVLQVGVTHYFSILKARQQLGYVPFVGPKEGMQRTLEFWKMKQARDLISPELYYWIASIGGMILTFCCAFVPSPFMGVFEWIRQVALFIFRSQIIIRAVFVIAFLFHLGEGVYAWLLARRVDPANAKGWFWQTLVLGFPSLRLLLRRSRA